MIIGVSGKIGAGKDTLAQCIQEIDASFLNKKFAYKLKQCAAILTGFEDQWSQIGKQHYLADWGMTVGEFQQKLGTEAVRDGIHKNGWILALLADYKNTFHTPEQCTGGHRHYIHCMPNWIITDVRFENEAEAVRERGGFLVRINGTRTTDARDLSHISETALDNYDKFDYTFDNSQLTLNELMDHAVAIYDLTMNRKDGI